jgi:predicted enzyme related to lactoylglutathione lyase
MGKPVVHFEIGCRDSERTRAFYRQLFDWETDPYGPASHTFRWFSDPDGNTVGLLKSAT